MNFGLSVNNINSIYASKVQSDKDSLFVSNTSYPPFLPLVNTNYSNSIDNQNYFDGFSSPFENYFNDYISTLLFMSTMRKFDSLKFGTYKAGHNFNTGTNLSQLKNVYNPALSNKLANVAYENAQSRNTVGYCYGGVKDSLRDTGLTDGRLSGSAAFQADDILKNQENFRKIDVSKSDLKNLPAGCVIVWQPSQGHQYGHILVTLGDGREASDHVQNISTRNTDFSVFVPIEKHK